VPQERLQSLTGPGPRILTDKIEAAILSKESGPKSSGSKIRRQKRKRSKRAKEKMLGRQAPRLGIKKAGPSRPDIGRTDPVFL